MIPPPSISETTTTFSPPMADPAVERPLVVDLDGTMLTGDSLWEAVAELLRRRPFYFFNVPYWILKGKFHFKKRVTEVSPIEPSQMVVNQPLLDYILSEKKRGREIVLATGSHRNTAEKFSRHLGVFDRFLGSEKDVNLTGSRKREALVRLFGEKGFDYVGNSNADFEVWSSSHTIHVTNPGFRVMSKLARMNADFQLHGPSQSYPRELIRELRIHQWVKNCLVFVPLLASHRLYPLEIAASLMAFLCFSLCASSVYLLNDLLDLGSDRLHPTKRFRPAALGTVPLEHVFLLAPLLFFAACALSIANLPPLFSALLVGYYATTAAYSFLLKRVAILDVLTLSLLYTMRIIGGAFAIGVLPSQWILLFSIFIFTSLAFAKRYAEIRECHKLGLLDSSPFSFIPGRAYRLNHSGLIRLLGLGAGYASALVVGLYVLDPEIAALYPAHGFLWMIVPILLFWLSRLWFIAHLGILHADPVMFALRDKTSLICGSFIGIVLLVAALYVP